MPNVNKAQGNPRRKPDGFLHVWNFAATRASGMAGAVVNHIMDDKQRDVVENILIQRAIEMERQLADSEEELLDIWATYDHPKRQVRYEVAHNCWRFRKDFLKAHFAITVYGSMYAMGRNTAALAGQKINSEYIQVVKSNKLISTDSSPYQMDRELNAYIETVQNLNATNKEVK